MSVADRALTDAERFPLISSDGMEWLRELREHRFAPRYNMRCGDRLTAAGLERVREFEREIFSRNAEWRAGEPPTWVREFAAYCLRTVPFYRRRGGTADVLATIPPCTREDVQREPESFVPDDQPLDDLMNYFTAGTSGQRMDVLSHPEVASKRIPIFRKALARHGITLEGGERRVATLFVCSQTGTYTYASLSAYLGGAAHIKVNLNPAEWRDPEDRVRFIDELQPELLTGDPLSFLDLAGLPVSIRPKALISSAMALVPPIREQLEHRFGCPVIDIYSTCETGTIALATGAGHELFLHDVYIEILQEDGAIASPGERGEIAFTGGRNPFLPLLRYRTGDWAALSDKSGVPTLVDFEGRPPVVFVTPEGRRVNNIDITIAMRGFPLTRYQVHQSSDGSLVVRTSGARFPIEELETALRALFGADQRMTFEELPSDGRKVLPYTTSFRVSARDVR